MTEREIRKAPITINDTLRCLCINKDPIIIITYGNPMAGATQLSPYLADRKVYFLAGAWWTFLDPQLLSSTHIAYRAMRDTFPEHNYIFLTNDSRENDSLNTLDLPNFFCHHNAFIDERIFRPLPNIRKCLDAVYTARLIKIKRHKLAKDILKWGLLYGYDSSEYKKQLSYLRHLCRMMPSMVLLNGDPEINQYQYFEPQQICEAYNKAHVGLCLSAIEGGNYSTTEYMLCGLPVVSTNSVGGREFFLDQTISRIVEDNPQAVAQGVSELIDQQISPHFVRLQTLQKLETLRNDFIWLVNLILEQEGKQPDFSSRFSEIFINKMYTNWESPGKFIRQNGLVA